MASFLTGPWKARKVWLRSELGPREQELKDYLSHSIVERHAEAEFRAYLEDSFWRFLLPLSWSRRAGGPF